MIDFNVNSYVLNRCEDIIITVENGEDQDWSITIDNDKYQVTYQIQQIEYYFKGRPILIIPRNFTEVFREETMISVTLTMTVNGIKKTDTHFFHVVGTPNTLLYSTATELFVAHDQQF
jgi:hypothetical protein